jgi:glutaredoxin 3
MTKKITVYTIQNCPYCVSAKHLLTANMIPFEEIHVDKTDQEKLAELVQKSGMRTFPQIFCDDNIIGGYTELKKLSDEKGLKNTLL